MLVGNVLTAFVEDPVSVRTGGQPSEFHFYCRRRFSAECFRGDPVVSVRSAGTPESNSDFDSAGEGMLNKGGQVIHLATQFRGVHRRPE